jgi:activating signal cointegrator 1
MKALTLTQPWASLVAIGAKQIETRSWSTNFRGPLAIHAAKGFPRCAQDFTYEKVTRDCLLESPMKLKVERSRYSGGGIYRLDTQLPRGAVVATCNLLDCVPMESRGCLAGVFSDYPELDTPQERAFGDFSAGRWAWVLEDVKMFPNPIPAKGALGLWEWTEYPGECASDLE